MASGGKQHRMVFDIRGRRKIAVKVVYAVLAVLMGLSLFLVVGPVNLGELFNSNGSSTGEAAKPFEEQAERIEAKLRKGPEDPELLLSLTRARVLAGRSQVSFEPSQEDLAKAHQQYQQASAAWTEYLKATKEPSAGVAQLMTPALIFLAEGSHSYREANANIEAAVEAQQIVADQRPTLNSLSTLALYTYFTGDFAAADRVGTEAKKKATSKSQREELAKQLEEVKKRAHSFISERKKSEQAEKAAAKANKGKPESLESPASPLSGAFGGGGLTE
ncbi:MAG TPA: hypothetical protein VFL77_11035 [Solirubrobacterales bacterium]|nr:hypothetical protein [Solirubrobacterales bacterium]